MKISAAKVSLLSVVQAFGIGLSSVLTIAIQVQAQQAAWVATGSLATARSLHTATLLANGKVLVVGGLSVLSPCCSTTASAELYDPAAGQWSATGARALRGATTSPFDYDPATNTWSPAGTMNSARILQTVTLLPSGRVLVAGGSAVNFLPLQQGTAEIYDPATNGWTLTYSVSDKNQGAPAVRAHREFPEGDHHYVYHGIS